MEKLQHEKDFRKETGVTRILIHSKYISEYIEWLERKYSELKTIQTQKETNLNYAVEFGYKECEKGNNIEEALLQFQKVNKE